MDESQVYATIGEDGFARLVAAFYRQVPGDDVLGPMYPPRDLAGAEARLRDFLVGRFGGPSRYIEQRGHPRLRMRHAPFAVTPAARDHWLQLMMRALDEVQLTPPADEVLRAFFAEVSTMMINQP
jgi:hemoglobin